MTDHSGITYSQARHSKQVLAAARAVGIKGAAFAVLAYLCQSSDWQRPFVIRCKDTIARETHYHSDTVKDALALLRRGGFLVAEAYATGGRHKATVYRLQAGKGGENTPGYGTPANEKGGVNSPEKGGEIPPETGGKNSPPSNDPSRSSSKGTGGAFRAGRYQGGLDARQEARPPAGSVQEREAIEENMRFTADLRRTGSYKEARKLQDARRAALAESGQGAENARAERAGENEKAPPW